MAVWMALFVVDTARRIRRMERALTTILDRQQKVATWTLSAEQYGRVFHPRPGECGHAPNHGCSPR